MKFVNEEKESLLFLGINIEKAVRSFIKEKEEDLNISSMSQEEKKAFDYAMYLIFDIINKCTELSDDEDFVVLTDDEIGTEYLLEELLDMIDK